MLLGLPLAADFAGEPLTAVWTDARRAAWIPRRVASLREALPDLDRRTPGAGPAAPLAPLDPRTAERLRSLGYIQ
jgi:hypothetical protein